MARSITEIAAGSRFGRLTFIEDVGKDNTGRRTSLFECDCGKKKVIRTYSVTCGQAISCGCLRGKSNAVSDEEKERMRNMARSMSPYAIAQAMNRDRTTVRDVVRPLLEKQKRVTKEGFFDVDAFFRSDFILQA